MPYDPKRHRRRSIRLPGYDYTTPGAYFITLCAHRRACLFGEVAGGRVRLNALGRAVLARWKALPRHARVRLDAFVIMPNHVHGILILPDVRRDDGIPVRRGDPDRGDSGRRDGPGPGGDPDRRGDSGRSDDPRRWGEASDSAATPLPDAPRYRMLRPFGVRGATGTAGRDVRRGRCRGRWGRWSKRSNRPPRARSTASAARPAPPSGNATTTNASSATTAPSARSAATSNRTRSGGRRTGYSLAEESECILRTNLHNGFSVGTPALFPSSVECLTFSAKGAASYFRLQRGLERRSRRLLPWRSKAGGRQPDPLPRS